jgi:hypothetical protein
MLVQYNREVSMANFYRPETRESILNAIFNKVVLYVRIPSRLGFNIINLWHVLRNIKRA